MLVLIGAVSVIYCLCLEAEQLKKDLMGVPGEYTAWSEPERDQECWGFYGCDYATEELQEQFDATGFPEPAWAENSKQGVFIYA